MVNYITETEMTTFTGLATADVDDFDVVIVEAQKEFELRTNRTYTNTEDDWKMAQRATAFLTAYYIRLHRQETEYAKEMLMEYHRLLKLLVRDMTPEKQTYWQPQLQSITQEDMGDTSR